VETGAISTAPPARHSGVPPGSPRNARLGRKCGLFPRSTLSPDSQIGNRRAPIGESLRPSTRIFPFCRDYWRRPGSITTAARCLQCDLTNHCPSPRIWNCNGAQLSESLGLEFEPWCAHHPVSEFGPSPVILQFVPINSGFRASGASLNPSLLAAGRAFVGLPPRGNFRPGAKWRWVRQLVSLSRTRP
jgi:hypothetical protein